MMNNIIQQLQILSSDFATLAKPQFPKAHYKAKAAKYKKAFEEQIDTTDKEQRKKAMQIYAMWKSAEQTYKSMASLISASTELPSWMDTHSKKQTEYHKDLSERHKNRAETITNNKNKLDKEFLKMHLKTAETHALAAKYFQTPGGKGQATKQGALAKNMTKHLIDHDARFMTGYIE